MGESTGNAVAEAADVPALAIPSELPVSTQAYIATLRPQPIRDAEGRPTGKFTPGHGDEIWGKWLERMHGREKHTPSEWKALIDDYRGKPAYDTGA